MNTYKLYKILKRIFISLIILGILAFVASVFLYDPGIKKSTLLRDVKGNLSTFIILADGYKDANGNYSGFCLDKTTSEYIKGSNKKNIYGGNSDVRSDCYDGESGFLVYSKIFYKNRETGEYSMTSGHCLFINADTQHSYEVNQYRYGAIMVDTYGDKEMVIDTENFTCSVEE